MASFKVNGSKEEKVQMPFSLRFEPHEDVKSLFPKSKPEDAMKYVSQLNSIPHDSKLYNVYGMTNPKELEGKEILIGTLQLEGGLIPSRWADEKLFFRHQRADDDLKLRPDWEPYMPKFKLGSGCPFL